MSRQTTSWINPKLEIKDSLTHGVGTFAREHIEVGEIVIVQGGRIITETHLDTPEYAPLAYHCFQVEKDFYICPIGISMSDMDGILKVNHSCDPNCGMKGQITMVAMKDIAPGDEITFDYVMTDVGSHDLDWKDMRCNCGAKNCRKIITGEDWRKRELQNKYRGYFSRHVQDLIDSQNNAL